MSGACQLGQLAALSDTAALAGLRVHAGALEAEPRLFTCCAGSGHLDRKAESLVRRCCLRERLASSYQILRQYAALYNALPDLSTWAVPETLRRALGRKLAKQERPGTVVRMSNHSLQEWWALAFIAAWRHGCSVLVVDFAKSQNVDNELHQFTATARQPLLVLGLNVRKLWDVQPANQLDMLVSFAYQSQAMAWFAFETQGEAVEAPMSARRGIMSRKVAELKTKSPLQFIEPACYSRLAEMCDAVSLKS